MTFLQLNYIIAVSEEKSISRAAERLRVSQPSISRLIANLEHKYGLELFYRGKHHVEPTYAGKIFLQRAQQILQNYRNLESMMYDLGSTPQGKLTFGCSTNHSGYLLTPMLHKLSAEFPYVEFFVVDDVSSNLYRQAALGKIDLVYSHVVEQSLDLHYIPVTQEELVLVVPPNHLLAARANGQPDWRLRDPIHIAEIANEPFIRLQKDHSLRTFTDSLFKKHKISPPVKLDSSSNNVAHKLAVSGLGVTILPESEVRFNHTNPRGVYFSIEDRSFKRQIYISYLKSLHLTSVVSRCIDIVSKITSEIFNNRLDSLE